MQEISMKLGQINTPALDAALKQALNTIYYGLSFANGEVIVYLDDTASAKQITTVQQIVQAHDPDVLTTDQQVGAERQAALETLRQINRAPIDLSVYEGAEADIRHLAEKVAWLELEFLSRQ